TPLRTRLLASRAAFLANSLDTLDTKRSIRVLRCVSVPLRGQSVGTFTNTDRDAATTQHESRIRGGSVDRRKRHIIQPQVHAELAAMMDDVIHEERADDRGARQREDRVIAILEGPRRSQITVRERR